VELCGETEQAYSNSKPTFRAVLGMESTHHVTTTRRISTQPPADCLNNSSTRQRHHHVHVAIQELRIHELINSDMDSPTPRGCKLGTYQECGSKTHGSRMLAEQRDDCQINTGQTENCNQLFTCKPQLNCIMTIQQPVVVHGDV
jgi:hypothetical protein